MLGRPVAKFDRCSADDTDLEGDADGMVLNVAVAATDANTDVEGAGAADAVAPAAGGSINDVGAGKEAKRVPPEPRRWWPFDASGLLQPEGAFTEPFCPIPACALTQYVHSVIKSHINRHRKSK